MESKQDVEDVGLGAERRQRMVVTHDARRQLRGMHGESENKQIDAIYVPSVFIE